MWAILLAGQTTLNFICVCTRVGLQNITGNECIKFHIVIIFFFLQTKNDLCKYISTQRSLLTPNIRYQQPAMK